MNLREASCHLPCVVVGRMDAAGIKFTGAFETHVVHCVLANTPFFMLPPVIASLPNPMALRMMTKNIGTLIFAPIK